jgi:hypothetical protein
MSEAMAPTRDRNRVHLSRKNQKWTPEEDALLRESVAQSFSMNWKALEPQFPGKKSQQLFERWTKVLDPFLLKGAWTRQEDETIVDFVRVNGCKSWTTLAKMLPGRIGKQCRERWMNHLNPELCRDQWTREEDCLVMELHERFGNKWSRIAEHMPGRADNMIKNRWYSILSKKTRGEVVEEPPRESTHGPGVEEIGGGATSAWTGFVSPAVQITAPLFVLSPTQRFGSVFTPWAGEMSSHGRCTTPTLSENRAELMNLLISQ